jgi:hypothetical protein
LNEQGRAAIRLQVGLFRRSLGLKKRYTLLDSNDSKNRRDKRQTTNTVVQGVVQSPAEIEESERLRQRIAAALPPLSQEQLLRVAAVIGIEAQT